jgi:hypothetical protein
MWMFCTLNKLYRLYLLQQSCAFIIIIFCMRFDAICVGSKKTKLNSVAVVRKRTIPTERPPLVGEVSANLCG